LRSFDNTLAKFYRHIDSGTARNPTRNGRLRHLEQCVFVFRCSKRSVIGNAQQTFHCRLTQSCGDTTNFQARLCSRG
jgi:hypothetical protein